MAPKTLMNRLSKTTKAFTLIELAVILAVLAVLGTMILPAMARVRGTSSRVACANNLKQTGVAFRSWRVNHSDASPMFVLNSAGGPPVGMLPLIAQATSGNAAPNLYPVFGVMSNELSTPKTLI